jgi:hypothetical protein
MSDITIKEDDRVDIGCALLDIIRHALKCGLISKQHLESIIDNP